MKTLDEAWNWYRSVRFQVMVLNRFGEKHWDLLPWDGSLGRDDRLREVSADDLTRTATQVLDPLEDFAVLLFFSVFESILRQRVLAEIQPRLDALSQTVEENPFIVGLVRNAVDGIEHGAFFRVLDIYKPKYVDLVEEVNQVRRYRNWVAHGRRSLKPHNVDPDLAFARLSRFLDAIGAIP